MHLQEITSHSVVCTAASARDQAARLMREFDACMVLVLNDQGRVVWGHHRRDICTAASPQGQPLATIPVIRTPATWVGAAHENDSAQGLRSRCA